MPEPLDREEAQKLFKKFRTRKNGVHSCPEMASLCLICGSIHIMPKAGEEQIFVCKNCGFAFYRAICPACGKTVDGRDPENPLCRKCGLRICVCGQCNCGPPD
jgi:hypothetical protein